ncbi:MAG: efflux RND transporter periplasmic adaptor subunit [Sphingomonas bacterium]|nr:efflux RND transporter periplasmic adaptor subunit [Sphingomonas bacterium]
MILWTMLRPTPKDYEYVAQKVDKGEVVRRVTASGKLRALNTIKVGAEVSGQITRVFVDFNSSVSKGQVLAEIDPTRLRARVAQSRAQVAVAQASLAQAQASISRTQSDIGTQERDYGRRSSLAKSGFTSKAGLDTSANALAASRAGARTAIAQAASARAQIAQAQAELSSAELDLSRTTIVAPASGVIINKLVEPGTTVAASFQTPNLFEIAADTTRMQVEASVDEADIGQVLEGQPVRFTVDAYPGDIFAATVRQIRKSATELQNVVSYLVILDVDNADGKLLPGMTANVEIITGSRPNVVRVPTSALRFRPRAGDRLEEKDLPAGTPVIYLATDDPFRPERRVVKLGLQGEDYVEIVKGVTPGDHMIIRSKSTAKKKAAEEADDGSDYASSG